MLWSRAEGLADSMGFDAYIQANLSRFEGSAGEFLRPIVTELDPLHAEGRLHGGIHPEALRYRADHSLDREFFKTQKRAAASKPNPRVAHAYLAPETIVGGPEDCRVDCYALGALMFQVITGHPPAPAARRQDGGEALDGGEYPGWPAEVISTVNRCLDPDPKQRPATAREVWGLATGEAPFPAPSVEKPRPVPAPSPITLPGRLPNASVRRPYRQSVRELFKSHADGISRLTLAIPPDIALTFDEAEGLLHGSPAVPGEFTLSLHGEFTGGRPPLDHVFALTINPDPASLWKNLPSDAEGRFAKPDQDQAHLVSPDLVAVAASLRGRSHAHKGKYRDDDFSLFSIEPAGWKVFIVADGAGSAKFSRRGSQIACATARDEITRKLTGPNPLDDALVAGQSDPAVLRTHVCNILVQTAYAACSAIQKQATEEKGSSLRDFSTTFIVVLAKKLASGWFLASFAIGDGGAGALLGPDKLQILTEPDSGDFAGQTVFLTMPQIFSDSDRLLERVKVAMCEDFRFLAVMTDGVSDPIFSSDENYASATVWEGWRQQLAGVFAVDAPSPGDEKAVLEWLNFHSPGNHDDRTLIIAAPKPLPPPT